MRNQAEFSYASFETNVTADATTLISRVLRIFGPRRCMITESVFFGFSMS